MLNIEQVVHEHKLHHGPEPVAVARQVRDYLHAVDGKSALAGLLNELVQLAERGQAAEKTLDRLEVDQHG